MKISPILTYNGIKRQNNSSFAKEQKVSLSSNESNQPVFTGGVKFLKHTFIFKKKENIEKQKTVGYEVLKHLLESPVLKCNETLKSGIMYGLGNVRRINLAGEYDIDFNSKFIKKKISNLKQGEYINIGWQNNTDTDAPSSLTDSSEYLTIIKGWGDEIYVLNNSLSNKPVTAKVLLDDYGDNIYFRTYNNNYMYVSPQYIQNSKETTDYLRTVLKSNEYTNDCISYVDCLIKAHQISTHGVSRNNAYYVTNHGNLFTDGGKIRKSEQIYRNVRTEESYMVAGLAKKYNDNYDINKISKVYLDGIDDKFLPSNYPGIGIEKRIACHEYPPGIAMVQYIIKMHETANEIKQSIDLSRPEDEILEKIAVHYQYAANARPFRHINNSLFMNEINVFLEYANMPPMLHGELLDHAAQRLQPKNFVKYFIDAYKNELNLETGNKSV